MADNRGLVWVDHSLHVISHLHTEPVYHHYWTIVIAEDAAPSYVPRSGLSKKGIGGSPSGGLALAVCDDARDRELELVSEGVKGNLLVVEVREDADSSFENPLD